MRRPDESTDQYLARRRHVVREALRRAPDELGIPESDILGIDPDESVVEMYNGRRVPFHSSWEVL